MTRLLEFITALVIVLIIAVIVGLALPSSGHVQRSATYSKDVRYAFDLFDNFRRFPEYSVLKAYDPDMKFQQSEDKWYGPGANVSWTTTKKDLSSGKLTIVSDKPGFQDVEEQGQATIVWSLDNDWHGSDKHFTIHLQRAGRSQNLVKITWAYDVDYGWNLINHYAGLYIHGKPDAMVEYSLKNVGDMLASMPSLDYSDLDPRIVQRKAKPVLLVSTQAKRNLTEVGEASDDAVSKIKAAMKKLGVHQAGPRIRFTTDYGSDHYKFDVAIPIDSDTVKINGKQYTLTAAHQPKNDLAGAASGAQAASTANVSSVDTAGSSAQPASAASSGKAKGARDDHGRLIVTSEVRGMMAFGGKALEAVWYGSPAGIPPTRLRLQAYASTHGYPYNPSRNRIYDRQVVAAGSKGPDGNEVAQDQQTFKVYLPISDGPDETPEQKAGLKPANPFFTPVSAASSPVGVGSAPIPAASAPAKASSAPAGSGHAH